MTLEIPGGLVDPGEDPLEAGLRELREEAGFTGGTARLLGSVLPNPAIQDNRCWTAFVDGVVGSDERAFDEHEELALRLVPEADVADLIRSGQVEHALVVAAFHLWGLERG